MLALTHSVSTGTSATYAIGADFCRIFARDMNSLYLLSFLLTGDRGKAEQSFAAGLGDALKANRVFKEWARSWARRAVIQNAIRMIKPAPHKAAEQALMPTIHAEAAAKAESDAALTPVLKLRAFERFVFVMSVLEGYSDQDCSILLGCSRRAVALARIRAAERIAGFAESGMSHAGASPDVLARKGWLAQSA